MHGMYERTVARFLNKKIQYSSSCFYHKTDFLSLHAPIKLGNYMNDPDCSSPDDTGALRKVSVLELGIELELSEKQ